MRASSTDTTRTPDTYDVTYDDGEVEKGVKQEKHRAGAWRLRA